MVNSGTAHIFTRLALSQGSSDAFGNDGLGYIGRIVQGDAQNFTDDDEIILLGSNNTVSHAIIVRYGSIIADRQSDFLKIPSSYDSNTGIYTTRFSSRSKNNIYMETLGRKNVMDFRIENGFSYPTAPPANAY